MRTRCNTVINSTLAAAVTFLFAASHAVALDGEPMAVRKWRGGMVSIETHWGLKIAIHPPSEGSRLPHPADLVLFATGDVTDIVDSDTIIVESGSDAIINHHLARKPNTSKVVWTPAGADFNRPSNAVHVRSLTLGGVRGSGVEIVVDAVRIVFVSDAWLASPTHVEPFDASRDMHLLILSTPDVGKLLQPQVVSFIKSIGPRALLINQIEDNKSAELKTFASAIEAPWTPTVVDHNTLALSQPKSVQTARHGDQKPELIVMGETPWQLPAELVRLFAAMEESCLRSQRVFGELSVQQMNFKPSDGTHTPRWNAEHMMGRQLLFFSQIYHELDPAIPIMDLNPNQMPPEYVPAHPDWDGREESRQMQRVSDFCRRFSYLLEGVSLDTKAPGSTWTPRGLLVQMRRHYNEHTTNTLKKFDLPDWPTK